MIEFGFNERTAQVAIEGGTMCDVGCGGYEVDDDANPYMSGGGSSRDEARHKSEKPEERLKVTHRSICIRYSLPGCLALGLLLYIFVLHPLFSAIKRLFS